MTTEELSRMEYHVLHSTVLSLEAKVKTRETAIIGTTPHKVVGIRANLNDEQHVEWGYVLQCQRTGFMTHFIAKADIESWLEDELQALNKRIEEINKTKIDVELL